MNQSNFLSSTNTKKMLVLRKETQKKMCVRIKLYSMEYLYDGLGKVNNYSIKGWVKNRSTYQTAKNRKERKEMGGSKRVTGQRVSKCSLEWVILGGYGYKDLDRWCPIQSI
jgi:hypothetical protein